MITAYYDRLEGDKAVLLLGDDFVKVNFPKSYLPSGINPGDYIKIDMARDDEQTKEAEEEAIALLKGNKG